MPENRAARVTFYAEQDSGRKLGCKKIFFGKNFKKFMISASGKNISKSTSQHVNISSFSYKITIKSIE